MLTLRSENLIECVSEKDGNLSAVRAEIDVDTADELPETDGISGRILHQGSTALIIKEGRFAVLAADGHWYEAADGKIIK